MKLDKEQAIFLLANTPIGDEFVVMARGYGDIEVENTDDWYQCDDCGYMAEGDEFPVEDESGDDHTVCPKCGNQASGLDPEDVPLQFAGVCADDIETLWSDKYTDKDFEIWDARKAMEANGYLIAAGMTDWLKS